MRHSHAHRDWLQCSTVLVALALFIVLASRTSFAAPDAPLAAWRVTSASVEEHGLRSLDGGDGQSARVQQAEAPCLTNKPNSTPPSSFLYFATDKPIAPAGKPLYLTVEYFDTALGAVVTVEYDSSGGSDKRDLYCLSVRQWGEVMTGSNTWKTAVFLLEKPAFTKRENLGADFRLGGTVLFVRSLSLSADQPANCEELSKASRAGIQKRVQIGSGGQLIIGGFDPARKDDALPMAKSLEKSLPGMVSLGVTSHEGYVRWNLCEPEEGNYDWSVYDAFVDVYKKYDIKWVPFLIVGSAYSLPDWYYKKPGSQGYVCLEHGKDCDVESLWNPELRKHVSRFIKAFCEHYGPTGVIESILLGITGNYGEAIYPVTGNDWTADIHGPYHSHPGYWAGDMYAIKSFHDAMKKKYRSASRLNAAWGTHYTDITDIFPLVRDSAPNDRAWLDFSSWYIDSMTDWAEFWLTETRKNFPKGDIYLCTGGHAPAEHGSDFGEQCKAAARIHGGVRITNEASDACNNFSLTRWVASAGWQYGAYFSFEPAGEVTPAGVPVRIYNASTSGARGLHYYYPNIFGNGAAAESFARWGNRFQQQTPQVEIYCYYPETYIKLKGYDFLRHMRALRDDFDFGYLSDAQIHDGGLARAKALILIAGNVAEVETWKRIQTWVRKGGLLLYADGVGRLRSVEGDERAHDALFGANARLGRGRVAVFHGDNAGTEYRTFLSRDLATARELAPATRAMVSADGKEDGVLVSVCPADTLSWLNTTDQETTRCGVPLPPHGLGSSPTAQK
ncbi:MAG: beta-galactosidase [Candidatus Hydrogenedentes bacterium]|nr:beta-galactosidase [Candidatus Hydrogenedentota bacterium]